VSSKKIQPIQSLENLRDRLGRFLYSPSFGRPEVSGFLKHASTVGNVALFGGMLRDISLLGNAGFDSDVDVVVQPDSNQSLENVVRYYPHERTKYGGYRVRLSRWSVDIWTVQSTWAFTVAKVGPPTIENLVHTTFFDWDAIAFDLKSRECFAIDGYVRRINDRILDINLERNPNPLGNVVKALRYCERYDAALSPRLSRYIQSNLEGVEAKTIGDYEARVSEHPVLTVAAITRVLSELSRHVEETPIFPFHRPRSQEDFLAAGS
jgi:hypothetical protein